MSTLRQRRAAFDRYVDEYVASGGMTRAQPEPAAQRKAKAKEKRRSKWEAQQAEVARRAALTKEQRKAEKIERQKAQEHERWKVRVKESRKKHLRVLVFERDRGVCALCGIDTCAIEAGYRAARGRAYTAHGLRMQAIHEQIADRMEAQVLCIASGQRAAGEVKAIEERLRRLGFRTEDRTHWQAHHVEGLAQGGEDTLKNCQTICTRCHARESAIQAGQRARKPKKAFHAQAWQAREAREAAQERARAAREATAVSAGGPAPEPAQEASE